MRRILQIVPKRSEVPDGIGDYALRLAEALQRRHALETVFLAGTPHLPEAPEDGWRTASVANRTAACLEAELQSLNQQFEPAAVILHVAGYGYARRGAPVWLLRAVRRWRSQHGQVPMIGIFHELFAKGRPWQSSYWLSGAQAWIARGLLRSVDSAITTNSPYLDRLRAWQSSPSQDLCLMPVVSTVGEPRQVPGYADRPKRAAVFGQSGNALTVYREGSIAAAVQKLGIEEIIDIGTRAEPLPTKFGGAPVRALGRLEQVSVSHELLACRFGLMSYDISRLGKSTILAAYTSHGVVPVCAGAESPPHDGLIQGQNFLCSAALEPLPDRFDQIQDACLRWYRSHDTENLARHVSRLCCQGNAFVSINSHA